MIFKFYIGIIYPTGRPTLPQLFRHRKFAVVHLRPHSLFLTVAAISACESLSLRAKPYICGNLMKNVDRQQVCEYYLIDSKQDGVALNISC